ncbi:hypothetical protein JCM5353_004740 [Sporobolomyces roseus]
MYSPTSSNPAPSTLSLAIRFILRQLEHHKSSPNQNRALVIGIQGPQGSGKSHLATQLLTSPELRHLSLANLSLDDLYFPHSKLVQVAQENPGNPLLKGRGQAGTHDLRLGMKVLQELRESKKGGEVRVPVFEKSLNSGEGDRVAQNEWVSVKEGRVDVVIFEGWMLGFRSIEKERLEELYRLKKGEATKELGLDYDEPFYLEQSLDSLQSVNGRLGEYEEGLWSLVDGFLELRPERMGYVWEWRLEQEHNMKRSNGGIGMTDDQVKTFISRYMPGYELFLDGIEATGKGNSWEGKGLRIEIGKERQVLATKEF